jgi:type III secretory pathway component EscR
MGAEAGTTPLWAVWALFALAPLLLAACTAFTKVSVVLAALRVGLGAETLLPWSAMLALAVVVTAVVMGPTALMAWDLAQTAGGLEALARGELATWLEVLAPLRNFLAEHAAPEELVFFAELTGRAATDPFVLVPGFLVTELTEALHMAVLLLVPFVVVDLVVAQALTLLGMGNQQAAPIALPAKILLFIAAGGWDVVVGGLVEGYLR